MRRRDLAAPLLLAALAPAARPQTAPAPAAAPADDLAAARARIAAISAELSRFDLPIATEPCFQFQAR